MSKDCKHKRFHVPTNAIRLEDKKQFMLEVKVYCADCRVPFKFVGLSRGLNLNGVAVNVDGTEAYLAIAPENEVIIELESTPYAITARRPS